VQSKIASSESWQLLNANISYLPDLSRPGEVPVLIGRILLVEFPTCPVFLRSAFGSRLNWQQSKQQVLEPNGQPLLRFNPK